MPYIIIKPDAVTRQVIVKPTPIKKTIIANKQGPSGPPGLPDY